MSGPRHERSDAEVARAVAAMLDRRAGRVHVVPDVEHVRTDAASRSTRPIAEDRGDDARRSEPDRHRLATIGAAAVAVLGVAAMVVMGGGEPGDGLPASTTAPVGSASTPVPTSAAPATVPKVALDRTLSDGVTGDDVRRLQQRLTDLGFDPGPIDGAYGTLTEQAVWAFEKLVLGVPRQEATGQVTPAMWDRIQDPVTIAPRRSAAQAGANHVEIYLPEQVMVVFEGESPRLVTHISSGELDERGQPQQYCETITVDTGPDGVPLPEPIEKAVCGLAKTPGGVFDVDRMVAGTRNGPLGSMWNPIYFNYGIAIHGALNVPLAPASHGCVRIPMHISEYLQSLVSKGELVYVWDGVKEPEQQTEQERLPVFDWPDPNATTTTSSTSSTVPATTSPTSSDTTVVATAPPTGPPSNPPSTPPGVAPTAPPSTASGAP